MHVMGWQDSSALQRFEAASPLRYDVTHRAQRPYFRGWNKDFHLDRATTCAECGLHFHPCCVDSCWS